MDWLTRLPLIGTWLARLMKTHAWRAYEHLEKAHWNRLAAAITFTSFIALFPLLTLAVAVGATLLDASQLKHIEDKIAQQVPGIAAQLDIGGLVNNAGTVGAIAGALFLFTGIGWVGCLRECLRALWVKEEDPGNPILRKIADGGVLLGLGAVALLSFACSTFVSTVVSGAARELGLAEHHFAGILLGVAGFLIAVLVDFVMIIYMLTWLPRVTPDRRSVVVAGLIGAVGFELLKLLISGYLQGVAGKSVYGAFGVPVALLLWINLMAKLLLYCASWTATQHVADGVQAYEVAADHPSEESAGSQGSDRERSPGRSPGESSAAPYKPGRPV
jgi:membrane protein